MDQKAHYTKTLLKGRGWSEKLIKDLLGQPDRTAVNSHHRSGPPVLLWEEDRVHEAEKKPAFVLAQKGRAARRPRGEGPPLLVARPGPPAPQHGQRRGGPAEAGLEHGGVRGHLFRLHAGQQVRAMLGQAAMGVVSAVAALSLWQDGGGIRIRDNVTVSVRSAFAERAVLVAGLLCCTRVSFRSNLSEK